jgi:Flp pilus assembly pilin Flp
VWSPLGGFANLGELVEPRRDRTLITKHRAAALTSLPSDQSGTTAIEYAMIVLLIGLVLISLQGSIGSSVINFFTEVGTNL